MKSGRIAVHRDRQNGVLARQDHVFAEHGNVETGRQRRSNRSVQNRVAIDTNNRLVHFDVSETQRLASDTAGIQNTLVDQIQNQRSRTVIFDPELALDHLAEVSFAKRAVCQAAGQ